MAIQLQVRRGTTAQNDAFTGAVGELSVNTDTSAIRVHDGVTAGGVELARSSQIDSLLVKSVAGAVDVTLSAGEAGNSNHEYTGILTGDINVIVPAVSHNFTAENLTTGAYTLTVKTSAGAGVLIPQGKALQLYCNGTDVEDSNSAKANDSEVAKLAGATFTGPVNTARGTVAMHATTMDIWAQPNIIDGTGSAVTITAIANAPQAGAVRILYPITGTIITHGATFSVQGNASYTTGAGDALVIEAVTTSTYNVQIIKDTASAVKLNTANGYGSTATTVRRWTNVVTNTGPDITYADSAANGGSFTINSSGLYSIKYADQFNAAAWMGISLNLATGGISTAAVGEFIASEFTSTANGSATVAATEYLTAGDVIRAHTDGVASGTNVNHAQFTITRVG